MTSQKGVGPARNSVAGNSGQVAIGDGNVQHQFRGSVSPGVTGDEMAELLALLNRLRAEVVAQPATEQQADALSRVDQLEEAVTAEEVDLNKLDYVKLWFAHHLPRLAGLVASIVIHPIVGKVVDAAGESAASEFRRRFQPDPSAE